VTSFAAPGLGVCGQTTFQVQHFAAGVAGFPVGGLQVDQVGMLQKFVHGLLDSGRVQNALALHGQEPVDVRRADGRGLGRQGGQEFGRGGHLAGLSRGRLGGLQDFRRPAQIPGPGLPLLEEFRTGPGLLGPAGIQGRHLGRAGGIQTCLLQGVFDLLPALAEGRADFGGHAGHGERVPIPFHLEAQGLHLGGKLGSVDGARRHFVPVHLAGFQAAPGSVLTRGQVGDQAMRVQLGILFPAGPVFERRRDDPRGPLLFLPAMASAREGGVAFQVLQG
jgi:hypothetical protein